MSNKREYMSGACKRKLKKQKEENKCKFSKISQFLTKPDTCINDISSKNEESENTPEVLKDKEIATASTSMQVPVILENNGTEILEEVSVAEDILDLNAKDKASYLLPPNSDEKQLIIACGAHQPDGPFLKDDKSGRSFSSLYYTTISKAGVRIKRNWLCYSVIRNYAYCQACWLFSQKQETSWTTGYTDWRHLSIAITRHELSDDHLQCCVVLQSWFDKKTLIDDLQQEIKVKASFWRKVLHRIINITLTLAMSNLSFRGHRESDSTGGVGNFLSIVHLLAKYDDTLQQLIAKPKRTVTYLSPTIQNEIIALLSNTLLEQILHNIKATPFYSILIDSTQDISKIDQLSFVIRYVEIKHDDKNRPTQLNIEESFLGFFEIVNQSAANITETIVKTLNDKYKLNFDKLRGQSYDGAACMSGIYNGVQARIKLLQPKAIFVHCAAHNLNLVLNDAFSEITEIKLFFATIESLYLYFSRSIQRWQLLIDNEAETVTVKTLKKLCPTRWSSRNDCLEAVRFNFKNILKILSIIILKSKKKDERDEAISLKKNLERFEFILLTVILFDILQKSNIASKYLQSPQSTLDKSSEILQNLYSFLQNSRKNFKEYLESAVEVCKCWDVPACFEDKRRRKVKKFVDELCEDQVTTIPEEKFKTSIFYRLIDIASNQVINRFKGMSEISKRFKVLQPKVLISLTDEEIYHQAKLLNGFYDDFTDNLGSQLASVKFCLKNELAELDQVLDFADLLLVRNSNLSSSFPDVCTAIFLFLTLPVTTASCERSFSKLKIIKNYLRSTMAQERLKNLAILSIENELAKQLDT